MTQIIDLNSKRSPVIYRVTIVHHYDDSLEFRVEDVADDPRSREAVMSAFRRVSGAEEEIENLKTDLRQAIFSDLAYTKEIESQNVFLREETARLRELREAVKPFTHLENGSAYFSIGDDPETMGYRVRIKRKYLENLLSAFNK